MPSRDTQVFSGAASCEKKDARFLWLGSGWIPLLPLEGVGAKLVTSLPCLTSSARFVLQHAVLKLPFSLLGVSWVIN